MDGGRCRCLLLFPVSFHDTVVVWSDLLVLLLIGDKSAVVFFKDCLPFRCLTLVSAVQYLYTFNWYNGSEFLPDFQVRCFQG